MHLGFFWAVIENDFHGHLTIWYQDSEERHATSLLQTDLGREATNKLVMQGILYGPKLHVVHTHTAGLLEWLFPKLLEV